jgi:lipid A ethanolaminephosphotransferase
VDRYDLLVWRIGPVRGFSPIPDAMEKNLMKPSISADRLLLATAAFIAVFANIAFFRNILDFLPGGWPATGHFISLSLLLFFSLVALFSVLSPGRLLKPVLIFMLLTSSLCAYFMDTYNTIIDTNMLVNVIATDGAEARDLMTFRLFAYLALLGILPSILIANVKINRQSFAAAFQRRLILSGTSILIALGLLALSSGFYSSFLHDHKSLRYYANPLTPVYAAYKYAKKSLTPSNKNRTIVGADAAIPESDIDRELIIMVVGETARADRFSLNGYERLTNPLLETKNLVSFTHVTSCGTSTAISVPCMFSLSDQKDYDSDTSTSSDNLLDVLGHAKVNILWRDNNSSSKGVSDRVNTEDYRSAEMNEICDPECRDEGMLLGLNTYVEQQASGDILIVLHQMGSHGPAYYKRYPAGFRLFEPTCETSQLNDCNRQSINNTYDNTIVYTDYFLSKVIDFLASYDNHFETAMVYVSDHGESLGESGMYLHGMPNFLAPQAQTGVPWLMWFGKNFDNAKTGDMRRISDFALNHDNVFHTMLGMFEIESEIYQPGKDLLQISRDQNEGLNAISMQSKQ